MHMCLTRMGGLKLLGALAADPFRRMLWSRPVAGRVRLCYAKLQAPNR